MIHIDLEPEAGIEPGHQWLVVEDSPEGRALATLLWGHRPLIQRGRDLLFPHDLDVDQNIVALINEFAHVRFQSPTLVQLTMQIAPVSFIYSEEDGGLEGP